MKIAIIEGSTIKSIGTHKELFPNTAFPPTGITNSFLTDYNAKKVVDVSYNLATQKLKSVTPFIDGDYVKEFEAVSLTTDEKKKVDNSEWKGIRAIRDGKLKESDWTQVGDSVLDPSLQAEWKTYRQALRDITKQTDPFNITWPTTP